jgi:hypothetical protein
MLMRATYQNFPTITDEDAFTVTITEPCIDNSNVLTWTPVELVDRSYNLYSPSVTYPWVDTTELTSTETEAICGDW